MRVKAILPVFLLTQLFLFEHAIGAKLLGVFPYPARSHYILGVKLMKGYAEAGHDVTMITSYETNDLPKNVSWKDVYLEGLDTIFKDDLKDINLFKDSDTALVQKIIGYQQIMLNWVNRTLYHPELRAFMTSEAKFDAVITEQFYNDAHKYLAHHFQCPLILLSSLGPMPWLNNIVGNPSPPAYIPHILNEDEFFQEMTFYQRSKNVFYYVVDYLFNYFYYYPLHNKLVQQAFPGAPSIEDIDNFTALVLLASHLSILEPVPLVPNMVEIGGYHIDQPKSLPKDMQEFLDSAKDGVIYFSMGSNIKSKDMPDEKRKILLNVFGKLKQKVLWKFEDEHLVGKPENVLIRNWMPQQDLLAHPNVKLFITHGGFLSVTETVYHGVPILAIPVFADQYVNAKKAVQKGYGLQLPYNDKNFNEETIRAIIQELVGNPKYMEAAKRRSQIFHDRPLKPMENAVYWTEYVIRHKGAAHLRVAGAQLSFYKYFMLDLLAFLLVVVVIVPILIKAIFKKLFCRTKIANKQKKS